MNKTTLKVSALAVFAVTACIVGAQEWKSYSNPSILNPNYERNFSALPLEGRVNDAHLPWSDTYWPNNLGSIAFRWNHPNPRPFKYEILNESTVKAMTPEQIAQLSPAEKFDLARGRYDFPLTRWVLKSNRENAPSWHGICHGWAPGAIAHGEPAPVTFTTQDGVQIPFGSSDVKALISYYYGVYAYGQRHVRQIGRRCNGGWIFGGKKCKDDVNAGALHIILANQLGLMNAGFVGDVTVGKEVWNQPIVGYRSKIVGERGPSNRSAPGTVKEVRVQTVMNYTIEISPTWEPVIGTAKQKEKSKYFDYWLELNSRGEIIGGTYNQGSDETPDFLWSVKPMQFSGDFSILNDIYRPASETVEPVQPVSDEEQPLIHFNFAELFSAEPEAPSYE